MNLTFDGDIGLPERDGLRCVCGALDPRFDCAADGRITGFECGRCREPLDVRLVPTQLELEL